MIRIESKNSCIVEHSAVSAISIEMKLTGIDIDHTWADIMEKSLSATCDSKVFILDYQSVVGDIRI
jgi:hypothetical protein